MWMLQRRGKRRKILKEYLDLNNKLADRQYNESHFILSLLMVYIWCIFKAPAPDIKWVWENFSFHCHLFFFKYIYSPDDCGEKLEDMIQGHPKDWETRRQIKDPPRPFFLNYDFLRPDSWFWTPEINNAAGTIYINWLILF